MPSDILILILLFPFAVRPCCGPAVIGAVGMVGASWCIVVAVVVVVGDCHCPADVVYVKAMCKRIRDWKTPRRRENSDRGTLNCKVLQVPP